MTASRDIHRLLDIMAALRDPKTGCPWDVRQTFRTIAPYTIEEAYEVADAIERGDTADLRDELGDLLLQVVFHARMAQEEGHFDFGDVVEAISEKLVRRHPHVFAHAGRRTETEVNAAWRTIKAQERMAQARARGETDGPAESLLDGVPVAMPEMTRAIKLQEKASTVGFDWSDARLVLAKIREEVDEVEAELDAGDTLAVQDEVGDLLFAVANLARHVKADPEAATRRANAKFQARFAFIERALRDRGRAPAESSLDEMDALWNEAKTAERGLLARSVEKLPHEAGRLRALVTAANVSEIEAVELPSSVVPGSSPGDA